jgi:Na+/H+-dicarboxylate symporter
MSLTNRILLAMVAGILTGSLFNLILHSGGVPGMAQTLIGEYLVGGLFDVVGRIFVASLKLLVVPLVMVSLICGASSLGDSARMGPIAMKTLGFYLLTTAIAVSLALLFATFIAPGSNVNLSTDLNYQPSVAPPLTDVLVDIFPSNPIRAMAGQLLPRYGSGGNENGRDPHGPGALRRVCPAGPAVLGHGDRRDHGPGRLLFHRAGGAAVTCPGYL